MPLKIIRNDLTKMSVDVIVNAANTALKVGSGVCGAIFSAAGAEKLQAECDRLGKCNVGEAVITSGYSLPARYVIHTVGPIWRGGNSDEARLLHNCYTNSLMLALEQGCKSIAFPLVSSGIYGYPKDQAFQIAVSAISEFLLNHEMTVYLVVYDKKAFILSEKIFSAIEKFIDANYVEEQLRRERRSGIETYKIQQLEDMQAAYRLLQEKERLDDVLAKIDETFSQMLLRIISEKGLTDVQTYNRANVDRKLFSKIRNGKVYNPSKVTAIAFAIALELNLDQTRDLLRKAGYALSHSNKFDLIIEYFIQQGNYDIYEINEALFAFDQVLLGA